MRFLKKRFIRPWGVWIFTTVLLFIVPVSFVIQPSVELQSGTLEFGTSRSVHLSEGVLTYQRNLYSTIVDYVSPGPTAEDLARLRQKRRVLRWNSGRGIQIIGRNPNPVPKPDWKWFVPSRPHASSFSVPLVSPSVLFAILSYYSFLSERRRRRILAGHCGGCNYSLHGLDGGVCPECGEGEKSED